MKACPTCGHEEWTEAEIAEIHRMKERVYVYYVSQIPAIMAAQNARNEAIADNPWLESWLSGPPPDNLPKPPK